MPSLTPNFLFSTQALDAAEFYVSVFPNSKITETSYYGEAGPLEAGMVLAISFELDGTEFTAINSGAAIPFSESISFRVNCSGQAEVDHYWSRLSEGGEEGQCGWLKDRFGASWQVTPAQLGDYLGDPNPERAARAMQAMLGMRKIDLAVFEAAVNSE